jgi:pilus assembly protein FimV
MEYGRRVFNFISRRNVMNAGAKMLRSLMLAGILISAAAGVARAGTDKSPCVNDTDCGATPQCGGDVCNFSTGICEPATASGSGQEGWCTAGDPNAGADDCKCKAQGAKCSGFYCTFTVPPAGGGTAGASGTAGTTGTAGTSGTAGATGTAGASTADGGTKSSSSSGGCSVAPSTSGGFAAFLGLALVAGGLVRRRRRA